MSRLGYLRIAAVATLLASCGDPLKPETSTESSPRVPTPAFALSTDLGGGVVIADLGTLDGTGASEAFGVNSKGQVVGWSNSRNFLWDPSSGQMRWLGNPWGDWNLALDINEAGEIVGGTAYVSWLWTPEPAPGQMARIDIDGPLGFYRGHAWGINNTGLIVGSGDGSLSEGWVYERATQSMTRFPGVLGIKVNDNGVVIGYTVNGSAAYAWDFRAGAAPVNIGNLGGRPTVAYGINASGQVVGFSHSGQGTQCAYLWDAHNGMRELGTLGGATSAASGINAQGYVVGTSATTAGPRRAFLWDPNIGRMIDLGTLPGGSESAARDITDVDPATQTVQIVGMSTTIGLEPATQHATRWTVSVAQNRPTYPTNSCGYENKPPVARITAPSSGDEGQPLSFDGGGSSDPDGDALTFGWDLDGDGEYDDATGASSSRAFDDDGTYTIRLQVTDTKGASSTAAAQLTVTNVAPAVSAGADQTITSGGTASLSGTFNDPGVRDMPWTWSWSSGQSGSTNDQAATVLGSQKFCKAGTYDLRLSVTDKDGGTGSDALVVTVNRVSGAVDIKPEAIHLNGNGGGMIIAHVYSIADYDATTLDPATVVITNGAGTGTAVAKRNNGTYHLQTDSDLNGDGRNDALIHFRRDDMKVNGDLTEGTTQLLVLGDLADCRQVKSIDTVRVVP